MSEYSDISDPADDPSSSMISLNNSVEAENLDLDIDVEDASLGDEGAVSSALKGAIVTAIAMAVGKASIPTEVYVRIVGLADSQQLNNEYRGKDRPTNVLSFPAIEPHDMDAAQTQALTGGPPLLLGDIIISAPVIVEEARQQNKTNEDHLAHMAVHGVLHLIGYDHIDDQDAQVMEDLERDILASMNIDDPYQDVGSHDG